MSVFDAARLTVCIDFKNPHAYLANEPAWALVKDLRVESQWLPFAVSPFARSPDANEGDDRGTRHRRHRAAYHRRDLERYASARALTLADPDRNPDVTAANLALLCVRSAPANVRERFITQVFADYWRGSLDLEDPAALRVALDAAGADGAQFADALAGAGREHLAALTTELTEGGVFNVPAYVLDGEVYYGRAHLPMIHWLLTGKQGPGPL